MKNRKNTKARIFFVEDSNHLRSVLRDYFEILSYEIVDFEDGTSASKSFAPGHFDLCLLDVMMPDKDGFTLMTELRKIDPEIPVIFLTARTAKEDRIRAFKLGADDYITKPFCMEELVLRIEAVLRRTRKNEKIKQSNKPVSGKEQIYRFGDFVFNYSEMQLIHPTMKRTLTRKENDLLQLLCNHQNRLLPRDIILKEIWGEDDYSSGRSMDVFLTRLRSYINLGKNNTTKRSKNNTTAKVEICNVHGTGFILKVKE
ncbi:MAG: response regulator transcription factor [Bacteroidales bacterium]|jgi:DNA-binding response OmpR family regulator|nr:response regulator transcription factor [Bacteroidales bacterium]